MAYVKLVLYLCMVHLGGFFFKEIYYIQYLFIMKKVFYIFLLMFYAVCASAQTVNFKLQKNGYFVTEDGMDYVVVEYEGKTASELYSMVKSNIIELYNDPSKVMSENEPSKIVINAMAGNIYSTYKPFVGFISYSAYYKYIFMFKDGKIRINAPYVKQDLYVPGWQGTFSGLVRHWFDEDGKVKSEQQANVSKMELIFIYPINLILGVESSVEENVEEDWDW